MIQIAFIVDSIDNRTHSDLDKDKPSNTRIEVDETFKITGRGFVVCGIILNGEISIGDILWFDSQRNYPISGIEFVRKQPIIEGLICLVLPILDDQEMEEIRALNLKGRVFEIQKAINPKGDSSSSSSEWKI